jgi:hypothetical protein
MAGVNTVHAQVSWPEREEGADEWGYPISERREDSGVSLQGFAWLGRGLFLVRARTAAPALLSFFCSFVFLFCFPNSFKTFSKQIQIHSKQGR